ncbi:MAG: DNA-binding transcriptional regulator Fis [Arenicellales bacterium]|jgi:Fis family transcriptional regulator|nr:DNA-binding transcriptional regulator Fis [Arenicellales bacterium]MDP6854511.1 DNA-binding transcriptional regulator Fis [Arenicellales bacterium]MDP6947874.1 DNA-binding transcriptional regulator Fis [Arenicellales bacterium]|tara:strand:+ start:1375 stop:1617 length:243 start_codon:yes stop_codon:yes gene_type:complete
MNRTKTEPLNQSVRRALERYFAELDGEEARDLYPLVVAEVERPLLEVVMREAGGNQSRAARMLGLNRNTLRKKLARYMRD